MNLLDGLSVHTIIAHTGDANPAQIASGAACMDVQFADVAGNMSKEHADMNILKMTRSMILQPWLLCRGNQHRLDRESLPRMTFGNSCPVTTMRRMR